MSECKQYLGDGVYADFDGHHIVLSVEDGVSVSVVVYLDPDVVEALDRYKVDLAASLQNAGKAGAP